MEIIKGFLRRWFGKTINFNNVSSSKLKAHITSMNLTDSEEHDYTIEYKDHCITNIITCNADPIISQMEGFNDGGKVIGGKPRLRKGDYILLQTQGFDKIGKFLVLEIRYDKYTSERFTCYVVGMGYKQAKTVHHKYEPVNLN